MASRRQRSREAAITDEAPLLEAINHVLKDSGWRAYSPLLGRQVERHTHYVGGAGLCTRDSRCARRSATHYHIAAVKAIATRPTVWLEGVCHQRTQSDCRWRMRSCAIATIRIERIFNRSRAVCPLPMFVKRDDNQGLTYC